VAAIQIQRSHSPYHNPFNYDHHSASSGIPFRDFDPSGFPARRPSSNRRPSRPQVLRSWSNKSGHDGYQGKELMSERPGEQGTAGSSSTGGSDYRRPTATSATSSQHHVTGDPGSVPTSSQHVSRQQQPGIHLPPLPQAASVTSGSFPASRSSGLPSILNPATTDDTGTTRRRKFDHFDSPPRTDTSLPPLNTGSSFGSHGSSHGPWSRTSAIGSGEVQSQPGPPLRSPGFHAAQAMQYYNRPTGTISAQQTPFPSSPRPRGYALESSTPGGGVANSVSAAERSRYGMVPARAQAPVQRTRGGSVGGGRRRGLSSSASPGTTYSEFSQAGQASPSLQYAPTSAMPGLTSPYPGAYAGSTSGSMTASAPPVSQGSDQQRSFGIPISSASGQNVYQMMTLETTSGTVQLPVDVQAASRVADEKRRRNAGASARFRQRRKEKERESSTTIQKLDAQIKALGEDAEFYKRERDYFAGILMQTPGGERHFPRPQSPRHRRSSSILRNGSGSGSGGYVSGPEQMTPRSPEFGRNVRRRTSTISLPPPPAPGAGSFMSMNQVVAPAFAGQTYVGTPMAPQQPSSVWPSPLSRMNLPGAGSLAAGVSIQQQQPPQHHQHSMPGPTQMQAQPPSGPWNPYAAERRPPGPTGQP
jgi:hypothetical protein